jgi:RimJ/RimL family protein N-acetyltransferase
MEEVPNGPAYRITTSRLTIRCWDPRDAPLLKAAVDRNVDHLRPWMPWAAKEPTSLEARVEWLRTCRGEFDLGTDFVYGIFDPEEKEVVGGTGLHTRQGSDVREIGYWIQEKHTRKGFATEVSAALTKVAFLVDKVKRVEIRCAVENAKSAGIPKKLSFVFEGTLRKKAPDADGKMRDMMIWAMLIDEYPHSALANTDVRAFDVIGTRII